MSQCEPVHHGLRHLPQFAFGLILQEMFSGSGVLTEEARTAGMQTRPPVEMYTNPDKREGYQEQFDCRRTCVQRQFDVDMASLPGPEVANVWYWSNSCRTYCPWQLRNGGTRTFAQPQGDGTRADETEANELTAWLASSITCLDEHGKAFLFENQSPDGRYPKVWDDPLLQTAIRKTGAVIIPTFMGEFGLAPPDQPGKSHRKAVWLLVSRLLLPWAAALWRVESPGRQYVPLQGVIPGTQLNRTQFAAKYTKDFCQTLIGVFQQAFTGEPLYPPRPALVAAGSLGSAPDQVEDEEELRCGREGDAALGGSDQKTDACWPGAVSEPCLD